MSDLFDLPFEEDPDDAEPAATVPRLQSPVPSPQSPVPSPQSPVSSRRVLTVTELTVQVRDLLESEFYGVWVEGELSNCRVWNTGHL